MISTWIQIDILLFGHMWQVTARVDLGETDVVAFDEAFGVKDGRTMWWRGQDLYDRVPRVEMERIECVVIAAAREQLNSAAMSQRAMKG